MFRTEEEWGACSMCAAPPASGLVKARDQLACAVLNMARSRKHDRKGRSVGGPPFVRLFRYLINSPAWRDLSYVAQSAFVQLCYCYDGGNNGNIRMSSRQLGDRLQCSKDTAARAIRELEDHGFIETMLLGSFTRKQRKASEYRITCYACDRTNRVSSNEFRFWCGSPKTKRKSSARSSSKLEAAKQKAPASAAMSFSDLICIEVIAQ